MFRVRIAVMSGLTFASLVGCSVTKSQPKLPLRSASAAFVTRDTASPSRANGLGPAVRGALDLGNLEFRAGRFQQALAAYREAATAAPDNAAPYFGIYIAAKKLGNAKVAESALRAIARRSASTMMLSDSTMRALHTAAR